MSGRRAAWVLGALAATILLTRVKHFGWAFTPPDTTLAVLFLGGLWVRSVWTFPVLLATAALADQIAFQQGVSDWCVTPAYPWLIPAYACMWLAGIACRKLDWRTPAGIATGSAYLAVAIAVEFVISSGSFFLFSGYFPEMRAPQYWASTIRYFPSYAGLSFGYVAAAVAGAMALRHLLAKTPTPVSDRESN